MKQIHKPAWSRRDWLGFAAACALTPQAPLPEISGFYYRDYAKCLPGYLSTLAKAAYEKRNHELSLLTDPAAIRSRQAWVRRTFWRLIGGEPTRTPLNARTTGQLERGGYRVEKVVYESRPGLFVSANLYVPTTGKPPYPGALFHMGHSSLGKGYGPYQKCCQGLAQLGYVVLAFDPMGQGERIAYLDHSGVETRLSSVDEEHSVPGKQLLLLGDSASRYQVWDAIRSLDYLIEHPLVDPAHVGSTGQSGGATVTMLLACVDDRLGAAAISSGNTENFACARFIPPGSTDDAEQDIAGSCSVGFDRWDLLWPLAPKPLLVQVSAHDFFGTYSPQYLNDGREQFQKLAAAYKILGNSECLGWRSTPLPHGLTYQLRLDIYQWFERWLKKSDKRIDQEPSVAPEKPQTLWTGPTGNVTRDYQSWRPIDLITSATRKVIRTKSQDNWPNILPLSLPPSNLKFRPLGNSALLGVTVTAVEVNPVAGIWLPVWMFTPVNPGKQKSVLLVLDEHGRNAQAHEDGLYHRVARSGRLVCAADPRGIGDAKPELGSGNPQYAVPHNSEEDFAWASLILGNPLLAQRITDILALVRALKNDPLGANCPLALAATGSLTVPSLFAFAYSREIDSLYLNGGLRSFRDLLETENYTQPLANFAWDLFRSTDLPLLAENSSPRQIRLAGTTNAAGQVLSVEEVRAAYSSANVAVSPNPAWNDEALLSL